MNCEKIKLAVHDYFHNSSLTQSDVPADTVGNDSVPVSPSVSQKAIEQHLSQCDKCQGYYDQHRAIAARLRAIPKPTASNALRQRILTDRAARHAEDNHRTNVSKRNHKQNTLYLGIAASVGLAVITALLINSADNGPSLQSPVVVASRTPQSSVSTVLNKPSKVNFLVNTSRVIDNVTFTLSVPPQMALYGYAGRQTLSWSGKLKQGKNLLSVPVVALTEQSGTLVMKISHKDSIKEYRVAVNVRQDRVRAPIRTSGQLS